MLSAILHRKRKAAEKALADAKAAGKSAGDIVEQTHRVYGTRLLVRGALWISVYLISRGLLEATLGPSWLRATIALLPLPFFLWYLWTWTKGVEHMDELERRIELEALGFAFPATFVLLMTLGLLDLAITLSPDDFSLRHVWALLPTFYFFGLWRARRRYQ